MKVDSLHRYRLPGRVLLEKGVSEVGDLPPAAKKYLDQLIAAGIVKVLSAPSPAPKAASKAEETKQAPVSRTTETEPAPAHDVASAVDVRAKTSRKKDES